MHRIKAFVLMVILMAAIPGCKPERQAARNPSVTEWPTSGWRTGAPEEKGFDSLKLAEGLLAIRLGV